MNKIYESFLIFFTFTLILDVYIQGHVIKSKLNPNPLINIDITAFNKSETIQIKPQLIINNGVSKNWQNEKPNLSPEKYVNHPGLFVPQAPPIYPETSISSSQSAAKSQTVSSDRNGGTISTSNSNANSQSVIHPNGVVSSVAQSQSSAQSISQTAPVVPIGHVLPTGPLNPAGSPQLYPPVALHPVIQYPVNYGTYGSHIVPQSFSNSPFTQFSQTSNSISNRYGDFKEPSNNPLQNNPLPIRPGSYGLLKLPEKTPSSIGSYQKPDLAQQQVNNVFPYNFEKQRRRKRSINLKHNHKNILKNIQSKKFEGSEPRTFDVSGIIDAINGFLSPTTSSPPCHYPCSFPPYPPPPPPPPPIPPVPQLPPPAVIPCQPAAPCHPYVACTPVFLCNHPSCQHLPPCRPPHINGYPSLPNKVQPTQNPSLSIPACKPKAEKIIQDGKKTHKDDLSNSTNDESGEEVTGPCYYQQNASFTNQINNFELLYPTHEMNPYPINLYSNDYYSPYTVNSSLHLSRDAYNASPFSSSSSAAISQVGIGGQFTYFQTHTRSENVEQQSSGVKFLGSSATILKHLPNGTYETERTFILPCQNGTVFQIKVITLIPESVIYPQQIFQTISVIPVAENNTTNSTILSTKEHEIQKQNATVTISKVTSAEVTTSITDDVS